MLYKLETTLSFVTTFWYIYIALQACIENGNGWNEKTSDTFLYNGPFNFANFYRNDANLNLFTTQLAIVSNHQCISNATARNDPDEILYRELSAETYFNLPSHEPGDTAESLRRQYLDRGHFNARDWLTASDYYFQRQHDQPALKWGPEGTVVDTDFYNTNQSIKTLKTLNPDAFTIFHLCYAISYIWRRGSKGIHRYYSLRDTYYDHMPFEIGYITQTIMAKYQNVLELYEYSTRLEDSQEIGRPHLYSFYKNILEDCRTIIHLCNMIHEVTRKYRVLQYSFKGHSWIDVKYDPSQKFQNPSGAIYRDPFPADLRPLQELHRDIEGNVHEEGLQPSMIKKIKAAGQVAEKEKMRQYKAVKKQRNYFVDHGSFAMTSPTTRRTKRWRSNQPLVYGWGSDEN